MHWWKRAIFYETYVDQFAGTFNALADKLEYLKLLGVDCIHLLPFYPSPMVDDGYDIADYRGIRSDLGTIHDFSNFVAAAHGKGIKVLIDLVLNHTSTKHPWFLEAKKSRENPKRNFYLWSESGKELSQAVNEFFLLKSNNWIHNPGTNDYYFSTFYPEQADLNWNNPEVFAEMMSVMDFWADLGVDGFRLDAASHLIKKEGSPSVGLPETHALLRKIRAYLDEHHPERVLLGEAFGKDTVPVIKEYFGKGDECNLMYHFTLAGKLFLALKRNDPSVLQDLLRESRDIPEDAQWVTLLRHHDEMPAGVLPQNERDEVLDYFDPEKKYRYSFGVAMRLATMLHGDKQKILDAFRLLLSIPGSPILYYGDEIGMENTPLAAGEKDTRRAVRGKFDWAKAEAQIADPDSLLHNLANIIKNRKV